MATHTSEWYGKWSWLSLVSRRAKKLITTLSIPASRNYLPYTHANICFRIIWELVGPVHALVVRSRVEVNKKIDIYMLYLYSMLNIICSCICTLQNYMCRLVIIKKIIISNIVTHQIQLLYSYRNKIKYSFVCIITMTHIRLISFTSTRWCVTLTHHI